MGIVIQSRLPFGGMLQMHNRKILLAQLLIAALGFPLGLFAQNASKADWPAVVEITGPVAEKDKKPAPRRSVAGRWANTRQGNQSGGVQLRPNNGKPENVPPYTPYGLELYKSHKPLEGFDAVATAFNNDPRALCEPLGLPRYNHYDFGVQVVQDEYKVQVLYQYDNKWRTIWIDGRPLPK